MKTEPGLFERAMAAFCKAQGVDYEWVMPDPYGGREATFLRDVEMTRRASLVLAFFSSEVMTGGTEHIVEKAMDARTPVYAFGLTPEGKFRRIGEHDPDDEWGSRIPKV
jgi:hypothetical protein